jgi:hypothetical protein
MECVHNARRTLWNAPGRLEGICPVLVLDRSCFDYRSTLDEKEYAMSAMSNLHLQLTIAMEHTADKLREATNDGSGEIMEATCNTAIELLQVCANAFAEVREGSSNGN